MHILCPHCRNPIEVVKLTPEGWTRLISESPNDRAPEESLLTSVPTLVTFLAGLAAAILTRNLGIPGTKPRTWAHWFGIVLMLLPAVLFWFWFVQGGVNPRMWFARIRE